MAEVIVGALPRLAHLVTGDEIVPPETVDPGFRIRDANSDLVAATLLGFGRPLTAHRRVSDDRTQTIEAMKDLTAYSELLLVSGGASVGDHDHARPALEAVGFHFETHGVDLRPGKPVGLARRENQWAIVLPGNPVSHLAVLHLFVLPILLRLEGVQEVEPQLIHGILREPLSAPIPRRHTFWPAVAAVVEGTFQVTPRRFFSSGDLTGTVGTNALLSLPVGEPIRESGHGVDFLLLASPFSQR
jgi:molybdopterin molybdotransferase